FDAMGVDESLVDDGLRLLLEYRLIEPYDASDDGVHSNQRVAVSHSGRMHFEMATMDPIYLIEMALATPMRAAAVVDQLRNILKNWNDDSAGELIGRFARYCVDEDAVFTRIPSDALYNGQKQFREDFSKRWATGGGEAPNLFSG